MENIKTRDNIIYVNLKYLTKNHEVTLNSNFIKIFDVNVEEFMKPFIPLFKEAAISITIIFHIYQLSQYNKRICNSLLDRAKLAEFVIDQLIRRRKENIKNFKNFTWYKSFERLIEILTKIKTFAEKISQLHEIKKFLKVKNIKERFEILINEYDNVMMDLNFTMAITNEQQRKIDHENLKDDLSEIKEFLEKFDSIENKLKTSIIYEEVLNIRPNNKNVEVKNLDDIKLTKPRIIKDDDIRGRFIRKMYLNTNEVACIKAYNYESLPYYHNLATYMKATQSPNIIQFYGFAELEDFPVMVSEWAEFGNLRNIYLRDGITSLKLKLAYTLDVCRAIAYLNALGIYHKELQCSNVLVTAENIAKLKFSSPIRSLSSTFEDVRWRAPEMILNMKLYDQKCEIYSIGMLLWELIFERRPYEDINFSMMIDYVTNGGREKLQFDNNSSIMVNIQKSIKKIIKKAWSHDPDARMSISKLFIDLDTLIKSLDEDNNKVDNKMSLKLKNPSNYKSEVYKYDSKSIQNVIEPILSIDIGIKAHRAKNYEKAWKCFKMQVENQNAFGKYWMGYYLWEGIFVQKDRKAALTLYKEAADDFIVDAQYRYSCALNKLSTELRINPKEIIKSLQLAADYGSEKAQLLIGDAYLKAKLGYKKNLEMAILWYRRAALQNNKDAKEKLEKLGIEFLTRD
ncbi:unnamed protein product [Rhizophagus irregularis]|nr:unnamed protein product [Rhizophagus irregularis]